MSKIVTFGELMLRLQPYNYERFVQCDHVEFTFGGGEANVAVSLANFGMNSVYVTKLPSHAIGQAAVNSLRRYGVDVSQIAGVENGLAFISTKRVLLSEAACASMTGHIPHFRRLSPLNSTGMRFLKVPTGSISPESRRHWEKIS